jgi:hypothetical protein
MERIDHDADKKASLFWKRIRLGILLSILAALLITNLVSYLNDNERKFNRIRGGMTVQQVHAILGPPSGGMTTERLQADFKEVSFVQSEEPEFCHSFWIFHDGTVDVDWNNDGTVAAARWKPRESPSPDRRRFVFIRDILRKIGL